MTAAKHFNKTFRTAELKSIYEKYIINSSAVGIDSRKPSSFSKVLDTELSSAADRVINGQYKFSFYKEKLISKGAKKLPRVLSIPTVRDRVILKALSIILAKIFPCSITTIPQIKIDKLINQIKQESFDSFIKIDLQNFYPSIPHSLIQTSLKSKIRKESLRKLVLDAVRIPTVPRGGIPAQSEIVGVPQGLSVSNLLAEICMKDIDALFMNRDDLFYIRYVDDILILCDEPSANSIYDLATKYITKIGLKPHNKDDVCSKSQIGTIKDGFEFLGYKVQGDIISPKISSILSFESKIASVLTAFKYKYDICKNDKQREQAVRTCEWRLNLKITGCIFGGKRLGWAFYFSQSNDTSAFRHIDSVIDNMVVRAGLQGDIKVKSMLKAFYETRRMDKSTHRYITNFDTMNTDEKRTVLVNFLGAKSIDRLTDAKIDELFKKKFRDISKELEADVAREY